MLLSESATRSFEAQISELVNIDNWNEETRDSVIQELDGLLSKVSDEAFYFTKNIIESEINGVPLLKLIVYRELLGTLISFLKSIRDGLDEVDSVSATELDYEWITDKIRGAMSSYKSLDEDLDKHLNLSDIQGVEEL